MKTDKLTILPHVINNVEIEILNYKCDYVGIKRARAKGYYFIADVLYITYEGGSTGKRIGSECKLLLHPLSDLSKEITVNGETFRPFHKLDHDFELQNDSRLCLVLHGARIINLFEHPYQIMQKLFEWHFDVFGLIESGLAVDINTIEL